MHAPTLYPVIPFQFGEWSPQVGLELGIDEFDHLDSAQSHGHWVRTRRLIAAQPSSSTTMTKGPEWTVLPGHSVHPQRKRSTTLLAPVVALVVLASISLSVNLGAFGTHSLWDSPWGSRFNRVPFHAKETLDKCAALKVPAGPPKDFHLRTVSDRYTPGTPSTIIYNARIWTGERNGTEVVDGFIWLENGIVVGVGGFEEQGSVLKELRGEHNSLVKFVNAGWKWVTPGLGELYIDLCFLLFELTFALYQSTCTRTLGF